MIMVPIKEALTFDDVTLVPKYSEILPSEVDTKVILSKYLSLKIPLLSSAMDTVTESKMAIALAKLGGIGIIHRNLDIKKQIVEIKKVKSKGLIVGAAPGSWSQYTAKTVKNGRLISIDLKEMKKIENSYQIKGDFTKKDSQDKISSMFRSKVDVVLSDMAVNTTGIKDIDAIYTGELCKEAMLFSKKF